MQGFDLAAAAPVAALEEQGTTVELTGADGEPLTFGDDRPVTMTIAGTYSARYRKAERAEADRMLKRKKKQVTPEEAEERMMSLAAACVLAWDGFFSNGEPFACTPENVKAVLKAAPWIYSQVLEAMQDHARFFSTASTT
jgi:hypothetical protein